MTKHGDKNQGEKMAVRNIPYGYHMLKGEYAPEPDESAVVREIFAMYAGGKSYSAIAEMLAEQEAPRGRSGYGWNKNKIKRMLDDARYAGDDNYPRIVGCDAYMKVQDEKKKKGHGRTGMPFRPPCPVVCGKCGCTMARGHNAGWKVTEAWKCLGPECGHRLAMTDRDFGVRLTLLLNLLIKTPDAALPENHVENGSGNGESVGMAEARETGKLAREIDNMLGAPDIDKRKLKTAIFSLAAEKYKEIDSTQSISKMMRAEFEKANPLFAFDKGLFNKTVRNISIESDGEIKLVLKNRKKIGRSDDHAANSRNMAVRGKDSKANTA